jgi:hypothetical protein
MLDTTYQRARRATVGTSALGWVAAICLLLNTAFWGALMLDLLSPRAIFSPQSLQAALATVAFALVLPLFWSMMLPSSPAGRLLQKQSWATPGYVATGAAAVFLTWLAGVWLRAWWAAQPNVAETNADLLLTISSLIAGVLVPALAWCVTTPEQWIAAIEQARHVRRIEHAMKMEEAAMHAAYARAVSLLNADLTNLTIAQRREVAGILGGFARMQQHALTSIARSWKDMYGVEAQLSTVPDQELLAGYQQVAGLLADGADVMAESAGYADSVRSLTAPTGRPDDRMIDRSNAPHQDTGNAVRPDANVRPLERAERSPERTERPAHADVYAAARRHLTGAWRRADLECALRVSKTTAAEYLRAWLASGHAVKLTEPKDHYEWR